jgi:signal transduction histidine kinase/CheY-like chemotaxis protein
MMLESRVPALLALGPDLICIHNDAYGPILKGRQAALARPFRAIWPEAGGLIEPAIRDSLAGRCSVIEAASLFPSGTDPGRDSCVYFSFSPVRDDGGDICGFLHHAMSSLAIWPPSTGDAFWRGVVDRLDEGFLVVELVRDAGGHGVGWCCIDSNPAADAMLAVERADALGRNVAAVLPAMAEDCIAALERVSQTGQSVPFSGSLADPERCYECHAVRLISDRFAILFREVTQQRAAEDTLRQSQKMEAVGQLTGGLAHDFNNLLTGIVGSLEIMQARVAQGRTEELGRFVSSAMASAGRAGDLTHRLLAFSRQQTLDPKEVVVNRLLAGMEAPLQRIVGPAIKVVTIMPDDVTCITCDPTQLERALHNLALNARDAMPGGGLLTIETAIGCLDEGLAAIGDMWPGRYVTISVTDTGSGMSPQVVSRAIDPFFTTKPTGAGTGLGLSMAYGFVRQSGGQMRIHSKEGIGTTVMIYLPEQGAVPDSESIVPPADALANTAGQTVLVVDDEPVIRMLIREVLDDLGYASLEAENGWSGLRQLETDRRIDLLVTDVGLPGGMNGRQLADAARAYRPGLKVLFITGFAEGAAVGNGAMERGMEVMTKPFGLDALSQKIRYLVNSSRTPAGLSPPA